MSFCIFNRETNNDRKIKRAIPHDWSRELKAKKINLEHNAKEIQEKSWLIEERHKSLNVFSFIQQVFMKCLLGDRNCSNASKDNGPYSEGAYEIMWVVRQQ